jgi:hypothetical protein
MSQYRFQTGEMQEFVRGLFRTDYGKETDEVAACARASLDRRSDDDEIAIESGAIQIDNTQPIQTPDPMPSPSLPSGLTPPSSEQLRRAADPTGPQKSMKPGSGGLWSRLRDRFTK